VSACHAEAFGVGGFDVYLIIRDDTSRFALDRHRSEIELSEVT
jgi:hypothetical protein